jgi:hypothetical protein
MDFGEHRGLAPIERGLPSLRAGSDGGTAIELPVTRLPQIRDPLLPCRRWR